jgi:glutaredoxin-related protein
LERIKAALARSIIVIFLKGTPQKPVDGYQAEGVDLLDSHKIRYTYYDVF